MRRPLLTGLYAGLLLAVPGLVAVGTGRPFVFPSLGPTAYLLAVVPDGEATTARRVVGGHVVGVLAGLAVHWTVAPGLSITTVVSPGSPGRAALAASAVLAVAATTAGMRATGTEHAPACATTLIVALGILATPVDAGIIVVAVALILGTHLALRGAVDLPDTGGLP